MAIGKKASLLASGDDAFAGAFPEDGSGPMEFMGNLMDVMLVFACGLMIALVAHYGVELNQTGLDKSAEEIDASDMEVVEATESSESSDYTEVGTVFRDESTGQLYVVAPEGVE